MPRRIDENIRNELKIIDPISGSVIKLYYRIPTSEERVKYGSDAIELKDGQVEINAVRARQKWGVEILEGFEDGSFERKAPSPLAGDSPKTSSPAEGEDRDERVGLPAVASTQAGEREKPTRWVPISCNPKSPNYLPDWKNFVAAHAMDLIEALAEHVFEGRRILSSQEEVFSEKN